MSIIDNIELDDIVSLGWLTVVGASVFSLTAAVAYNIIVGRIALSGDIPIATVFTNLVTPIVLFVTALALLDVYGKRRIKTLLDMARGQGLDVSDVRQARNENTSDESEN